MSDNGKTPVDFVYRPPGQRNGRKPSPTLVDAVTTFLGVYGRSAFQAQPALNALVSDILNGKPVSLHRENEMRRFLGIEAETQVPATPCPTCNIVHGDGYDCGGGVVTLRSHPPAHPDVARMVAGLQDVAQRAGRTDDQGRVIAPRPMTSYTRQGKSIT